MSRLDPKQLRDYYDEYRELQRFRGEWHGGAADLNGFVDYVTTMEQVKHGTPCCGDPTCDGGTPVLGELMADTFDAANHIEG